MAFNRPLLRTSYEQDAAIFPTYTQKIITTLFGFYLIIMALGWEGMELFGPFRIPAADGAVSWLLGDTWLNPVTNMLPLAIAALGINILIGVTGQVSLGHAFFMGVGAYTAVALGGNGDEPLACIPFHEELGILEERDQCGLGMPMWVWLPMSGIAAAAVGIFVSPAAMKVRGLYLAIVTVGLVFIGLHLARMFPEYAGDFESGRKWPTLDIKLWKEETPLVALTDDGKWFGLIHLSEEQKQFFFLLAVVCVFIVLAKNLVRTRTGRALQAIRDRDIAAEVMGVPEFTYKRLGFAISSFYAGVGGALWASYNGRMSPVQWNLFLSVDFIAILLIGGAGTIAGTMLGTVFVELTPEVVKKLTERLSEQTEASGLIGEPISWLANLLLTDGASGNFGPINTGTVAPGWTMSVFFWNFVIYGVLIIVFLIFEPLGLYGIWIKIRNYWKRWPFSY